MTDMGLGCAKTRWKRLDASRFGLTASRRFGRGGFSLPSRAPEEVPARPPRLHWRREPLGRSSGGHSGHGNYGPRQCSLMAGFHRLRPHCALFHQLLHVDAVGRHRLAGFRHRHADLVVGGLQAHRGRRRDRAHRLRPLRRAAVHQHDRGRGRRNHLGRACLRSQLSPPPGATRQQSNSMANAAPFGLRPSGLRSRVDVDGGAPEQVGRFYQDTVRPFRKFGRVM